MLKGIIAKTMEEMECYKNCMDTEEAYINFATHVPSQQCMTTYLRAGHQRSQFDFLVFGIGNPYKSFQLQNSIECVYPNQETDIPSVTSEIIGVACFKSKMVMGVYLTMN